MCLCGEGDGSRPAGPGRTLRGPWSSTAPARPLAQPAHVNSDGASLLLQPLAGGGWRVACRGLTDSAFEPRQAHSSPRGLLHFLHKHHVVFTYVVMV